MYYYRSEADYTRQINVYELLRDGFFLQDQTSGYQWEFEGEIVDRLHVRSNLSNNPQIELCYSRFPLTYPRINLTSTPCNYGGKRHWFICPICSNRVGVIYFRSAYNACRECSHLTYETRKLSGKWKWAGKIISDFDIQSARLQIKRKYYNGRLTRNYLRHRLLHIKQRIVYKRSLSLLT